jgi:DNA-binding transcriptional ArsR family regulator
MRAKREFRNRDRTEVSVLDALVDRGEGMTVFELRTRVEVEIDALEEALANLKDDGLITTTREDGRLVIRPADRVVPETDDDDDVDGESSIVDRLFDRLGL